jgi:hypothetical protein
VNVESESERRGRKEAGDEKREMFIHCETCSGHHHEERETGSLPVQYTHPFNVAPRADSYGTKSSPDDRRYDAAEKDGQHSTNYVSRDREREMNSRERKCSPPPCTGKTIRI